MLIKVTQELIERYTAHMIEPDNCPIYHAVRAAIGPYPKLSVTTQYLYINHWSMPLPPEATQWQFDAFVLEGDELPPPIEFEINYTLDDEYGIWGCGAQPHEEVMDDNRTEIAQG